MGVFICNERVHLDTIYQRSEVRGVEGELEGVEGVELKCRESAKAASRHRLLLNCSQL